MTKVGKCVLPCFYEYLTEETPTMTRSKTTHSTRPSLADQGFGSQDEKQRHSILKNIGRMKSRHNVISRKDNLLLVPSKPDLERIESIEESINVDHQEIEKEDPVEDKSIPKKILGGKVVSLGTFQRDFELSDVFDYLKTGIACIIEDEVTQRFVAEELKSWNLMSRTNRQFEFINWKLTLFWIGGCFIRYFVFFPARLTVLVIGVSINFFFPIKE